MATAPSPESHEALASAAAHVYGNLDRSPISGVLHAMRRSRGPAAPLIAVHENTPLAAVLATLRDADIHSVPVYRAPPEEPLGRIYIGIVSVYDILANTVFQRMFDNMDVTKVFDMSEQEFQRYLALMEQEQVYFSTKIGDLVGKTRESSESWAIHSSSPISTLLQMLTVSRYHRVLVIDEEAVAASASNPEDGFGPTAPPTGSSIRLVTQTDLTNYLIETSAALIQQDPTPAPDPAKAYERIWSTPVSSVCEIASDRLSPSNVDANQPITSKGITPRRRVISVPDTMSAIAALRCMYIHRVTAVAVVGAQSNIVANLSASDLRGMTISNLEALMNPIFDFLESSKRRPSQVKPDQLRTVHPDTSLEIAANKMLLDHIHRVWIVDDMDHPTGVVSLTDVLSMFVPEGKNAIDI